MSDDKLADEIVRSLAREPKRWKMSCEREQWPQLSWYVRDDGLNVGIGFTRKKHAAVRRGEYSASLADKRSINRVWKAVDAWREWLRVGTLTTIARDL